MGPDRRELRVNLDRGHAPVAFDILNDPKLGRASFRLGNISRSGMFLECPVDLQIERGRSIQFAMRLAGDDEVTGVATVRWVRSRELGPYMPRGLGVQVIEFHDAAEKRYLEFLETRIMDLKISDLMDPKCPAIGPEAPVSEVVRLMLEHDGGAVVVTDVDGHPLGIFTRGDLLRICRQESILAQRVGHHMTVSPTTVATEQDVSDAFDLMRYGPHGLIPVVEEGILVGSLSRRDLLRHWSEYMELQTRRLGRNYDRAMGVIAHDLRTPIGLVQSSTAMLTSGEITAAEFAVSGLPEVVDNSCEMMLKLIDDILDVSRIRLGAIRLDSTLVDLEALARRVTTAFRPAFAGKSITLALEFPAALPGISADPLRLEQVLNNLISNALKFSPEGAQVHIGARPLHSQVELWVRDDGPGIPADQLQALFQEFGMPSNRPTRGEKSTGLGLAIAKRLVEAHGGTIEVDTAVGRGTTFTVKLPIGALQ